MGWVLKASLAAGAAMGMALAVSQPASAATYSCAAFTSINDVGPSATQTGSTPCTTPVNAPGFPDLDVLARSAVTGDGVVTGRSIATANISVFAGASSQSMLTDSAVVAGLQDGGADIIFDVRAISFLAASSTGASAFERPTGTGSFNGAITLFTDGGVSSTTRYSGCARNDNAGISVCNGAFDLTVPGGDSRTLNPTIHLTNGDVLHFNIFAQTSALASTPGPFTASAQGLLTFRWNGVRFDGGARGLQLIGTDGFDYARPVMGGVAGAAPEPASWALMIGGFGLAGASLRRRRAAVA